MPVFKVFFEKTVEVVVEGESREAVEEAARLTIDSGDIDYDWGPEDWELVNVVESDESPEMGIGKDSGLVHISDAVPAEERDPLECEHGREVDMLGRGCPECEALEDDPTGPVHLGDADTR